MQHLSHPKYRPDIDGLRAVAVLSVLLFHAFPAHLTGGFIGVDVFFVISGFLISTIILDNLDRQRFSFIDFYARRIRRIFPALLVVLAASLTLGWFVLLADEYAQLGKHVAAGAGFVANLVFWSEAGYFDTSAETKPLLHLWSLGIEEQFYLLWPLLVWLAWKKGVSIAVLIAVLVLLSFGLNLYAAGHNAVAAFYTPYTRFWELLCGGALAWVNLRYRKRVAITSGSGRARRAVAGSLSALGVTLLLWGFVGIDETVTFPGIWALLPIAGATLIIAAGPTPWINRRVLSHPLAVWFGVISFPLYLWHWPLLSVARILNGEVPDAVVRLLLLALSVPLAWLTYRLIERPLRFGRLGNAKAVVLALLMVAIGALGYGIYRDGGLESRAVVRANPTLLSGWDGGDQGQSITECGLASDELQELFEVCARDARGPLRYALLGDSKAAALYQGLVRTSTEAGRWLFIGGYDVEHGAPLPLLSNDPALASFQPLTRAALDAITHNPEIETVVLVAAIRALFQLSDGVIGGNLATYNYRYLDDLADSSHDARTLEGLSALIDTLAAAGRTVVILIDNPPLPSPQDCIARTTALDFLNRVLDKENPDCTLSLAHFEAQISLYRQLLNELRARHPDVLRLFDATPLLCDTASQSCRALHDGRLLYAYTDHISDYAAGRIGAALNAFLADQGQSLPSDATGSH